MFIIKKKNVFSRWLMVAPSIYKDSSFSNLKERSLTDSNLLSNNSNDLDVPSFYLRLFEVTD
jgi:hypothetical protein